MINEPGRYNIWFNGGTPFQVVVTPSKITIYKPSNLKTKKGFMIETGDDDYTHKVLEFSKYKKVFIPVESAIGNTILIEIANNTYIYVGNNILKFTTSEPILYYRSPIGHSGVPYPFAVSKNITYLMFDEEIQMSNKLLRNEDPYDTYYKLNTKQRFNLTKKIQYKTLIKST